MQMYLVQCLPSMPEAWVQSAAPHKPGSMIPTCDSRTQEVEGEDQFRAILGHRS